MAESMDRATDGGRLELPNYSDVCAAAKRLVGRAVRTPLLESVSLNEHIGGRLLIKAEPLQCTGSFKFRGAYNCISQLAPTDRARGVVAYSSGNHAQAVAAAANMLDAPATIVMPNNAPAVKVAGTRRYGAEIISYDRASEDREALAEALGPKVRDQSVLLARASRGREVLAERLSEAGATVEQVVVYQSQDVSTVADAIMERLEVGGVDWVTVTSSAIARSLKALLGDHLATVRLASISPITSEVLRELGLTPTVEAGSYTMKGIVDAILQTPSS